MNQEEYEHAMDLMFQATALSPSSWSLRHELVKLGQNRGVPDDLINDVLDGLVDAKQAERWIKDPPFARSPRPR